MKARVWDIETSIHGWNGRPSPYKGNNWTVTQGFQDLTRTVDGWQEGPRKEVYFGATEREDGWLAGLLKGVDLLVGANIKFDITMVLVNRPKNTEAFWDWVNAGGRIWDILVAEHVLRGFREDTKMLSLNDVAVKYGGTVKPDQVKALWQAGISTEHIDRSILTQYLIGDREWGGDIGNTTKVFLHQLALKQFPYMKKALQLDMLALLCTVEMEMNGIGFDVERGENLRLGAHEDLAKARETLQTFLPEEHREFLNLNSRFVKSALLYGGKLSYERRAYLAADGRESWEPWPVEEAAYPQKDERRPILDENGQPVLFKGGKQAGQPKTKLFKVPDMDKPPKYGIRTVELELPRRVTPPEGSATDTEGVWSTGADFLDMIVSDDSALGALRAFNEHAKDVSTSYWIDDGKGGRKGMMTRVVDGRIHPSFRLNNTATGRMSCESPNVQQLSKVSLIKTAFGPTEEGWVQGQADFQSLEAFSVALVTGDEKQIADLNDPDFDMHCAAVAFVKGITVQEAIRLCKEDKVVEADGFSWPDFRQAMKGPNFAYEYGAGVATIANSGGFSEEIAEQFIEFRRQLYPTAVQYKEAIHATVNQNVRYTGEVKRNPNDPRYTYKLGYGTWREKTGRVWAFEVKPPNAKAAAAGREGSVPPTNAGNYPFQGTGCDWMKAAMAIAVLDRAAGKWQHGRITATVHDAFYWENPAEDSVYYGRLVSRAMSGSNKIMAALGLDMKTEVPYSLAIGANWKDENALNVGTFDEVTQADVAKVFSWRNE